MAEVASTDLSSDLAREIGRIVSSFSIGLVRPSGSLNWPDAQLLGSGTLVQIGNTRAILTAHHVVDALPRSGELGLVISPKVGAHTLEVETLEYLNIARGTDDEHGPDLGAVILQPVLDSSLTAKKSFVNLDKHRERMTSGPPDLKEGLWCLCGLQDALTKEFPPEFGFKKLKRFAGFCPIGWVDADPRIGSFDYLTFPVPHGANSPMPNNIGGTSGGGLWQVLLRQKPNGVEVSECLLSGLAFFQGPIENEWSRVRCHGRESIYNLAYQVIQAAAEM
ncbi:hypothetical protein EOA27_05690 [Mesorhizobium sp. M2A.F.Ca.ET.037.01.1.1]|uniref:hypothetical protein n=1 Tax=unclassified Mesorhizobium TaxID=325217 RepID=UPI000FCA3389|nr:MULTISPECIES: hypothetical protein [unclassified Mesorhizobium]RUX21597.1 hypothetical protein EOA27_05690 [Mesorhizobium sp. M2A.F.Ca.ET.037.01.1.1]RUY12064.1 hypothetical protein EOA25_04380 [Mesorhizobium sp. M2A.F.Ca.ET.040.01.1.1]RWA91646.1 MAG: hypothetical protein EOQ31_11075 [Mesorhizobium sp.]TIV14500.1 MAG: hypothetical protein E5V95_30135 [Mesorhizobium sp.]